MLAQRTPSHWRVGDKVGVEGNAQKYSAVHMCLVVYETVNTEYYRTVNVVREILSLTPPFYRNKLNIPPPPPPQVRLGCERTCMHG